MGVYFVNAPTERVAKIDIWLGGYDFHSELIWLGKEYWRKRPDGFEHQLLEQDRIDQQVSRQKSLQNFLLDLEELENRKVSFYGEGYNNLLVTGRLRKKVNTIVQVSDLALLLKSKDDLLSSVQQFSKDYGAETIDKFYCNGEGYVFTEHSRKFIITAPQK